MLFYGGKKALLFRILIEHQAIRVIQISEGSVVVGAPENTARYFRQYFRPKRSVEQLKFLAAHIVLTAHRIDPHFIKGLDIRIATSQEISAITSEEKQILEQRSAELDSLIGSKLDAR